MARSLWKGSIGFGMVHVPVKLVTATREHDIKFRRYDPATNSRPRQAQIVTDGEKEREVALSELTRIFEFTPDAFDKGEDWVEVTDDDLLKVAPISGRHMQVLEFVPFNDIDPVALQKTWFLEPDGKHANIPYTLFSAAVYEEGSAAIVRVTMSQKEHLAVIYVQGGQLCLSTLYYADEIVTANRRPFLEYAEVSEDAVALARQLVRATYNSTFDHAGYKDDQQDVTLRMIEQLLAGEVIEGKEVAVTAPPGDILALIEKSLAGGVTA